MSDAKRKIPTCADCRFCREPVCALLRPCAKELPVCADFPKTQAEGLAEIEKSVCRAANALTCSKPNMLPYVYIGLMQKVKSDTMSSYVELDYVGYRRAEMCCCDWEFLQKVKVKHGFQREFAPAPKAKIGFLSCNMATNGAVVQYGKAKQPWENIEAFGLFLNEKGGKPEKVFPVKTLTIGANDHATFFPGGLEVPVSTLIELKN